jgi:hypothetical protein
VSTDVAGELVTRFYERLWNSWDDAEVDLVLGSDFVFRGSLGQTTRGRDGWRRYRDDVRASAPDFHNEGSSSTALHGDSLRSTARGSSDGTPLRILRSRILCHSRGLSRFRVGARGP